MRRILFAVALFLALAAWPEWAVADDEGCDRADIVAQTAPHPNFAAFVDLSAGQARAALVVISGGPEPSEVRDGLLVVLKDGAALVILWRHDGSCGFAKAPAEKLLRAIKGNGA